MKTKQVRKEVSNHISVLLTTEGTYPFHQGGVSQWCDIMVNNLKSVDFVVFSVLTDPYVTQKFTLPNNARLIRVPLWGTDDPSEHLDTLFSQIYLSKKRTTPQVIQTQFLPLFTKLILEIISLDKNADVFADTLLSLYDFFQKYDYKVCFKSQLTWNTYQQIIHQVSEQSSNDLSTPDVYSMIQSLGWIYRFFNIINTPIPRTTITHSSAAAFCGLPCVISKRKWGTPFLLTEHGVYLREQYLSLSKRGYSSFLNTFLIRLILSITNVNFALADQVSPVCEYNTRWERRLSNHPDRIEVIYNGVDHTLFSKLGHTIHERPTVVTVARIDPIKDLFTLMRAAVQVRNALPNVRFLISGSVTVPEYYERCLALHKELELENTVEFLGHSTDMAKVYERGDIVVQSSISEAFPYAIIEAMLAGKPVVTTDVGGIPEAVASTGILVAPGDPSELATGIIDLLTNTERRLELGRQARERALNLFTLNHSLEQYMKTYLKLGIQIAQWPKHTQTRPIGISDNSRRDVLSERTKRQALFAERAFALRDMGYMENALEYLQKAVEEDSLSLAAPVLLAELAWLHENNSLQAKNERVNYFIDRSLDVEHRAVTSLQQKYAERAYALAANGYTRQAISQLHQAILCLPNSPAAPAFLLDLSMWYGIVGEESEAIHHFIKYTISSEMITT